MGRTEDTLDISKVQICGLLGRNSLVIWEGETAFTQSINNNSDAIELFLVGRYALKVDGYVLLGSSWYWQRLEEPGFFITRDVAPSAGLVYFNISSDVLY